MASTFRHLVLLAGFLLMGATFPLPAQEAVKTDHAEKTLSDSRYANFGPGINLGSWFWPNSAEIYDPLHAEGFYTDADLDLIKSLGFRHVRLPVVPELLLNEQNPDAPNEWGLSYVDKAIDRILARGLNVTLALDAEYSKTEDSGKPFEDRLLKEPAFRDAFSRLWTALARHWNNRDPDRFFMEILNEPHYSEAISWDRMQAQFTQAIRAGAPHHTIVLSGANRGTLEGLMVCSPGEDLNVIYSAHLYDVAAPFCGQGNPRFPPFAGLSGLPYPVTPKAVVAAVRSLRAAGRLEIAEIVEDYGDQRWDSGRIQESVDSMAEWAQEHRCRVVVNEFGASSTAARPDRVRYIRDVASSLRKARIPYNYWEYANLFPDKPPSTTNAAMRTAQTVDRSMIDALGLEAQRKP